MLLTTTVSIIGFTITSLYALYERIYSRRLTERILHSVEDTSAKLEDCKRKLEGCHTAHKQTLYEIRTLAENFERHSLESTRHTLESIRHSEETTSAVSLLRMPFSLQGSPLTPIETLQTPLYKE